MISSDRIFENGGELSEAVVQAKEQGYGLARRVLSPKARTMLILEAASLELDLHDRSEQPINSGTDQEISLKYEQYYRGLGDPTILEASSVARELHKRAMMLRFRKGYKGLHGWLPNSIGYQRYGDDSHHISPHRDAASDQLLRATITLQGSASVRIHEALGNPDEYTNTQVIDELEAQPGDIMFLRAPGLGDGGRVVHEALPPKDGTRLILDLSMKGPEG